MADIFVSYSKADREHVVQRAAMLEAEGWSVWWDTSLLSGDDFRDVIMTELGRARVVLVLWTETAAKSDWVRSEAGRAQTDRKLIPVKLSHLGYKDVPPPFDVLHTENLDNKAAIKSAIIAQLAKPEVAPSSFWLASKELRYQALTWFGIIGGTLTLFSGLSSLIQLADWARWIVTYWHEWTYATWRWLGALVDLQISFVWAPLLSMATFTISLALGQRLAASGRATHWSGWRLISVLLTGTLASILFWSINWAESKRNFGWLEIGDRSGLLHGLEMLLLDVGDWGSATLKLLPVWLRLTVVATVLIAPLAIAVWATGARLAMAATILLAQLALGVLAIVPMNRVNEAFFRSRFAPLMPYAEALVVGTTVVSLYWLPPIVMTLIAPAPSVAKQLFFLAVGVALMFGLNHLSTLGLTFTAPRVPS